MTEFIYKVPVKHHCSLPKINWWKGKYDYGRDAKNTLWKCPVCFRVWYWADSWDWGMGWRDFYKPSKLKAFLSNDAKQLRQIAEQNKELI